MLAAVIEVLVDRAAQHIIRLLVEEAASFAMGKSASSDIQWALEFSGREGTHHSSSPASGTPITVVSHTPGRLRFQVPGLQGDPARQSAVVSTMRALPGIQVVSANVLTGNALIEYDPRQIAAAQILSVANSAANVWHRENETCAVC